MSILQKLASALKPLKDVRAEWAAIDRRRAEILAERSGLLGAALPREEIGSMLSSEIEKRQSFMIEKCTTILRTHCHSPTVSVGNVVSDAMEACRTNDLALIEHVLSDSLAGMVWFEGAIGAEERSARLEALQREESELTARGLEFRQALDAEGVYLSIPASASRN